MSVWVRVKCNCANRVPLKGASIGDWGEFTCGHHDGAMISTSPNDLITYGYNLERIYKNQPLMFEVWRRLPKWRKVSHIADSLLLSSEDALLWQLEIEQLQGFLSGKEFMGWEELQLWNKLRKEERLSYARGDWEPPDVNETLATGIALCRASQETRNPIEFT